MNTNERLNKLMDIYEPYVELEFIRDENGDILEVKEVFKNNITLEAITAYKEAQEIMLIEELTLIR